MRFETYRVPGEDALIIHETFKDTSVLKFHLTKGTAAIFKDDIDKIAAPENYYFRGTGVLDHSHLLKVHAPSRHLQQPGQATTPPQAEP